MPDAIREVSIQGVSIHEVAAGFEPAQFWQESPTQEQLRSLVLKYASVDRAAQLAEGARGPDYRALLAELSARWPAALRESELLGAERVAKRGQVAQSWLGEDGNRPAATRIEAALRCWMELHELIRDQLAYRRGLARGQRATTSSFAEWLDLDPERQRRWPNAARLPALVGDKLRVRVAYLWLAARAGLDLPSLNALLFERTGHWDRRGDDPDWSRGPTATAEMARDQKTI